MKTTNQYECSPWDNDAKMSCTEVNRLNALLCNPELIKQVCRVEDDYFDVTSDMMVL